MLHIDRHLENLFIVCLSYYYWKCGRRKTYDYCDIIVISLVIAILINFIVSSLIAALAYSPTFLIGRHHHYSNNQAQYSQSLTKTELYIKEKCKKADGIYNHYHYLSEHHNQCIYVDGYH